MILFWKLWLRRALVIVGMVVGLGICVLLGMMFLPLGVKELSSRVQPIQDRVAALELIEKLRQSAPERILPECRGVVLDHGWQTDEVYVLLHGLTNCPEQFRLLGEMLYESGANVLIPRTPYHGYEQDYMDTQKLLNGRSMLDTVDVALNAAHAFGKRITLIGLSVNGTTAAWMAQNRGDVDRVVLLAPFLAPGGLPESLISPAARLIYRMPNRLLWWDSIHQDQIEGPEHSYPMFATHPIAHVMRIGVDVMRSARESPPQAGNILLVTSASDRAVNNAVAKTLASYWQKQAPGRVQVYEFPVEEQVPHDMIDPFQPGARTDFVYPKLLELIQEM